jgi:hypothetical protein
MRFDVTWQGAKTPADLARFPHDIYLASGPPFVAVMDFSAKGSRAYAASAPFEPNAAWVRGRQVVTGENAVVKLKVGAQMRHVQVKIPPAPVGRLPLWRRLGNGWAVAELAYVRYGAARGGEAQVDGNLAEWQNDAFVPVGEAVAGALDAWAAGFSRFSQRMLHAVEFQGRKRRSLGSGARDWKRRKRQLHAFFDPRSPAELGTAGTFYWLWAASNPTAVLGLKAGETSETAPQPARRVESDVHRSHSRIFRALPLMKSRGWPETGDLGVSVWWTHLGEGGKKNAFDVVGKRPSLESALVRRGCGAWRQAIRASCLSWCVCDSPASSR